MTEHDIQTLSVFRQTLHSVDIYITHMVNATQSRIVKGWSLWNGVGRKRDLISIFPLLRAELFLALLLTKVAHLIVVKQKSS